MAKSSRGQLELVAAECRASARRIAIIRFERSPASSLVGESHQHGLWAKLVDSPPAFEFAVGGVGNEGRIRLTARFLAPSGEHRFAGSAPLVLVEQGTPAVDRVTMARAAGVTVLSTHTAELHEHDLLLLADVIQGALLAMAEHLLYRANRKPGDSLEFSPSDLTVEARDTLEMLWKLRAFSESSAVSVKRAAPGSLPKRPRRQGVTTIAKAAELGTTELKSAGLVEARQGVGTWLTDEGRRIAGEMFAPERPLTMCMGRSRSSS
jgi:hypothetical protein